MRILLLFALCLSLGPGQAEDAVAGPSVGPDSPLVIARGEDMLSLQIPRDEELVYRVKVDIGPFESVAGTVTLSSGVEPFEDSLLFDIDPAEEPATTRETAWIRIHAAGDYEFYSMDSRIETRLLPQDWPWLRYSYEHKGTEKRKRELLLGMKDGVLVSSYRRDTDKNAPKGERIWKDPPKERDVPAGTVDMLSAVFLVRTMLSEGRMRASFPLIDKRDLWEMRISRGLIRKTTVVAGTFDTLQVMLDPKRFPGEPAEEGESERFEGLFGIHGSIQLWVHVETGVPVRIQGDLPVGPLTLGVDIQLERYRGTPAPFRPLAE